MSSEILDQMHSRTLIMGILNCTPDSFSDGGQFLNPEAALAHAKSLIADGADILDIGGESTRPGAIPVPLSEERKRVITVIKKIRQEFPEICISVDTYKSEIAREALESGADIINDISAMRFDLKMAEVVRTAASFVILMHMKGTPKTFTECADYDDVVNEVIHFLDERVQYAKSMGIDENKIIVDPGLGFGKKPAHNSEILRRMRQFTSLGKPVLLGTSRKSYLGADVRRPVEERLEETIASSIIGVLNGANIIRVHDVKSLKRILGVVDGLR